VIEDESPQMGKYTVTGGAGFIGSHLVDALVAQGHEVVVLDDFSTGNIDNLNPAARLIRGDTTDPGTVKEALKASDGCFHLAAIASVQRGNEEWLRCHRVNLGGTVAVLDASRAAGGIPVVYASSAAIYGDTDGAIATEERFPTPITAYGMDKLGSELHASIGWLMHRVPTFGCRFFNVYGPRQNPSSPYSGVISIFLARALAERELIINGDGEQFRDFIHVADIVTRLVAAMGLLQQKREAYVANFCTGQGTTIISLAHLIANLVPAPIVILHGPPRIGDIRHSIGLADRANSLLGIKQYIPLRLGIRNTFYSLFGNHIPREYLRC
jgi:UDP-glucose 4-epimerase